MPNISRRQRFVYQFLKQQHQIHNQPYNADDLLEEAGALEKVFIDQDEVLERYKSLRDQMTETHYNWVITEIPRLFRQLKN